MGRLARVILAAAALAATGAAAEEFRIRDVKAPAKLEAASLQPGVIYFSDRRSEGPGDGLVRFEDWVRAKPQESRILSLYPGYREPVVKVTAHGVTKSVQRKLHMFVAEARFMISRPVTSADLARYAKQDFFERIDPAVKSRPIQQSDAIPLKDPDYAYNANPERRWCERDADVSCIESRYQLEGKLPMGVRLANKLSEGSKKIPEFIEFQSELRALTPEQAGRYAGLTSLTGLDSPVVGALEQNIFYVNQILQFGKILAVFQQHPSDPGKTVVTAFIALAIKTDVLEKRKEFGAVPVLRNLVPSQVLMGNSSFNTGTSISAGLPAYTRNRAKAIARIIEHG